MAEWLYEAGIGEARAALVHDGRIVAARIELPGLRLGTVADARLVEPARVRFASGEEAQFSGATTASIGAVLRVEVVREAIPEGARLKLARAVPNSAAPAPGPTLAARIAAGDIPVRLCHPHETDLFEAAGWSEVIDEAVRGDIAFPGGMLRMSPTPAMTLFDIDGAGPVEALSIAAARAVAEAIVRHDIGGSIGIDFPSVQGRGIRLAVAETIDAHLPQPFERTALNGFGFLQIVRPRPRASLPELLRADARAARARALLRQLERTPPAMPPAPVPPELRGAIRDEWIVELHRRTGRAMIA